MRQMAHAPNGTRAKWHRRQMAQAPNDTQASAVWFLDKTMCLQTKQKPNRISTFFLPALSLRATRVYHFLCCSCCCGDIRQNTAFLTNFTMLSADCTIAIILAQQPCPAALPGSLARQPCPAALPGSLAQQPCPAALSGSLAWQP
jgi:hypothetical protein